MTDESSSLSVETSSPSCHNSSHLDSLHPDTKLLGCLSNTLNYEIAAFPLSL